KEDGAVLFTPGNDDRIATDGDIKATLIDAADRGRDKELQGGRARHTGRSWRRRELGNERPSQHGHDAGVADLAGVDGHRHGSAGKRWRNVKSFKELAVGERDIIPKDV